MTDYHHSDRAGDAGATYQQSSGRDRGDINRARQAAEALFARKENIAESSAPARALPTPDQTARKPRILSAVPAQPTRAEAIDPPIDHRRPKPRVKIPPSHFARIRTWVKYGMTIPEVAEVYGVGAGDIEGVLQKA
jgi:hypothetical protein